MRAIDYEKGVFPQQRFDSGNDFHPAGLGYGSSKTSLARALFHLTGDLLHAHQEKGNFGMDA